MLKRESKGVAATGVARAIIQDPQIRRAASEAASPLANLSVAVGKRLARRRARRRVRQLNAAIGAVRALLATYSPQAIEQLQQLGVVERPKRKRAAPRFVAGAVAGAGAMYLFEPRHGRANRQQIQKLVSR